MQRLYPLPKAVTGAVGICAHGFLCIDRGTDRAASRTDQRSILQISAARLRNSSHMAPPFRCAAVRVPSWASRDDSKRLAHVPFHESFGTHDIQIRSHADLKSLRSA
jgi:hypothetical protein